MTLYDTTLITILQEYSDEVIYWIKNNYAPDEIFDDDELETWAEEKGWIKDD